MFAFQNNAAASLDGWSGEDQKVGRTLTVESWAMSISLLVGTFGEHLG